MSCLPKRIQINFNFQLQHGGHEMVINAILLSEDGLHVVSSGWDGRVIMWETATGSKVCSLRDHLIL